MLSGCDGSPFFSPLNLLYFYFPRCVSEPGLTDQVLRIWESTKLLLLQQRINLSGFVHLTSLGNTHWIFLGEFGFRGLAAVLLSWLINTIWIKCNPLAALGVGKPPRSEINPVPVLWTGLVLRALVQCKGDKSQNGMSELFWVTLNCFPGSWGASPSVNLTFLAHF